MAISLDETKKQMVRSAYEFFSRWGYPISEKELKVSVKAHGHTVKSPFWGYDFDYLIDCGLLHKKGDAVWATAEAIRSISELDHIDA